EDFEAAAEEAMKDLPSSMSIADQEKLYGLYKQSKFGDNETCRDACMLRTAISHNVVSLTDSVKLQAWHLKIGLSGSLSQNAVFPTTFETMWVQPCAHMFC
ncbi:unnamed protein product, partial [Ostreobium quekettii]